MNTNDPSAVHLLNTCCWIEDHADFDRAVRNLMSLGFWVCEFYGNADGLIKWHPQYRLLGIHESGEMNVNSKYKNWPRLRRVHLSEYLTPLQSAQAPAASTDEY